MLWCWISAQRAGVTDRDSERAKFTTSGEGSWAHHGAMISELDALTCRQSQARTAPMSTIVVAQKNGVACIGADTLSSLGPVRQRAHHVVNKTKIARIDDTFIGLTGTSASLVVMNSYFANPERPRDFSSADAIFETLRHAHYFLKNEYFMAAHPNKGDEYATTQFYGLAANPHGIFAIYSYRSAQQFAQFWSAGSGRDFALGAMAAVL